MTLAPERLSAVLRWLDAAAQQADVPASAVAVAREAVLSEDPRAYARCEQLRTLIYLSGCGIAVRLLQDEDERHELSEALLDLLDVAGEYDDPQRVVWEDRWQKRWDAYLHAINVAGLDREALLKLRTRGLFLLAASCRTRTDHQAGPRCVRPANRSARTPRRRRVITTPMSCNAPPTRESRMPARSTAPP